MSLSQFSCLSTRLLVVADGYGFNSWRTVAIWAGNSPVVIYKSSHDKGRTIRNVIGFELKTENMWIIVGDMIHKIECDIN